MKTKSMKRYITVIAALVISLGVAAQKGTVTDAIFAYNHYNDAKPADKNPADLAKAKSKIDEATIHPDTKDDSKTWVYRGLIYLAVYQSDFNVKMDSHKDITDAGKRQAMAFQEAPTANLIEATNALIKGKTLDAKYKVYEDKTRPGLNNCYYYLQSAGIGRSNQKAYAEAGPLFELAVDIVATDKKMDTVNINNAAISYDNGKIYDKAVVNYKKLTDAGYKKGNTWILLANAYAGQGDSAKYRETIAEGLKKYPMDQELLVGDVNLKMKDGKFTEAVQQLNALIAQRPDDFQLNFIVGNVYDRLANPKKEDGTDADKPKNYEEFFANAEKYYKKTIELKPTDFDATYNLGVLYYNRSMYFYNLSQSSIADAAKYKDMWEPPLKNATKYLEDAHKLEPKDITVLKALKSAYGLMGDNDNYIRVKEEIKKLESGQ